MDTTLNLLPLGAAICLLVALLEAWLLTAVRYLGWQGFKKVFPNYRDLVRSHIDFLMMSALLFGLYTTMEKLQISVPGVILWLTFIGAIYNPTGFVLQAMKPDIIGKDLLSKIGVSIGFLPLSLGMGWCSIAILIRLLSTG